ncbi:DUF2141 domain-containing protein [Roseivirga sp. 4D4]|uniref:DUF2141 domain-containing protein n=1 Tax=Roseivirga sp. 4D4 TaxID=1889784 RepID=UPI001112F0E9|nr:DUF2141 domain-containing protein [Roseivirga sp. 4D4]
MKRISLIFALMLSSWAVKGQDNEFSLEVNISGIKSVKGKLGLCLITDKREFLGDCSYYREFEVNQKTLLLALEGIKPNDYAITIYHDANSNGKLDTNFLGLPKERYGFSNNPRTTFGPPSFEKCLFTLDKDMSINLRLK